MRGGSYRLVLKLYCAPKREHLILHSIVRITEPVISARTFHRPATPLPFLRTIAHQRAPVAARGDENIWTFPCQRVFESSPSAYTFAIARACPVVFGTEAGWHARAGLVPAFVLGVEFDEGMFARKAATRAVDVVVTSALQEILLLDVVWLRWRDGLHGCDVGTRGKGELMGGIITVAARLDYVDITMQTLVFVILLVCSDFACIYLSSLLPSARSFLSSGFA
jgi:hypothetical protein